MDPALQKRVEYWVNLHETMVPIVLLALGLFVFVKWSDRYAR